MYQQKEIRRRRAEKLAQVQEKIATEKAKNALGMGVQGIKSNVKRTFLQRKQSI